MALKLFPILADPNAPSSFDGLDVSLAAGQMTALDASANSFSMTASTLTANGVPALWVDIVDAVVNPPATPALQAVLDAGNTASGANAFIELSVDSNLLTLKPDFISIEGLIPEEIFQATNTAMTMFNATQSNTFSAGSVAILGDGLATLTPPSIVFTGGDETATYSRTGVQVVLENGFATSNLASNRLSILGQGAELAKRAVYGYDEMSMNGAATALTTITPNQVALSKSGESATFTTASLAFVGTSPTETATLSTASLIVSAAGTSTATYSDTSALIVSATANSSASFSSQGTSLTSTGADARTTTYNNNALTMTSPVDTNSIVLTGVGAIPSLTVSKTGVASMALSQTALSGLSVDGSRTMSLTTPTALVNSATLASSGDITLDAVSNIVLSAGSDTLTLSSGAMLSASAGGFTDQYLVVTINGTAYKISLLAV